MATEIERKFLVISDAWRAAADAGTEIMQGYFTTNRECSIRVRLSADQANLNIKSAVLGISRSEYDYAIPLQDARELLERLCIKPLIEKKRYHVRHGQHEWEIDVFGGANQGLVVAELELRHLDEPFLKPAWAGAEVSHDARYYNVSLITNPYQNWPERPSSIS